MQNPIKSIVSWVKSFFQRIGIIPKIVIGVFLLAILASGGFFGWQQAKKIKLGPPKDPYVAFLTEVYDTVKTNYWDSIKDDQLINLYVLATQKLNGQTYTQQPKNEKELEKFLEDAIKPLPSGQKKVEFSSSLADAVLANLQPFGRSRLYSEKQTTELQKNVQNVNGNDVYSILGVKNDSTDQQIAQAYQQKADQLKKDQSDSAKQELALVEHAYSTLSNPQQRQNYDSVGAEASIEGRLLRPDILYVKMSKFSPTMVQELSDVTKQFDTGKVLDTMIFDLRGNIGGLIDGLPYILGPFIGQNQYAYQLFQQGNPQDFKTVLGWLPTMVRYKKVIILIDNQTQSSAEVMAATFKKYNVGLVVGTTTKGWGTVEKVFDLSHQIDPSQKFAVYLVHHITLREDGQPIEGRGVDPTISITDKDWQTQLSNYYHYQPIVDAVKSLLGK